MEWKGLEEARKRVKEANIYKDYMGIKTKAGMMKEKKMKKDILKNCQLYIQEFDDLDLDLGLLNDET